MFVEVLPSISCKGFEFEPDGDVEDEICAMRLFEGRLALVAEAMVGCGGLFASFTPDIWLLRKLLGDMIAVLFIAGVPFSTDAGGFIVT